MDAIQILDFQNRSLRRPFDFEFIDREGMASLKAQLKRREVTVLLGARQTGKTSLLRKLVLDLQAGPQGPRVLYMNMDNEELRRSFSSPVQLASYLEARGMGAGDILMLDEVQRIEQPGLYLKQIHDLGMGYKIVVSGSSSLEIRSETREHLRRRLISLAPLSLSEIAAHRGLIPARCDPDTAVSEQVLQALSGLVREMAVFGGYPAVWGESDPLERARTVAGIFDDYVRRDVVELLKVRNTVGFNDLVRALAGQVGGLVNLSKVAGLAGIDVKTARSYLEILEQTYVVHVQRPYSTNPRTEIKKSPKCPFADNGMLGSALATFVPLARRGDPGPLLENLVVSELAKRMQGNVRYWRTTSGAEVDVVLLRPDGPVPIEVKSASLRRPKIGRSFRSFLDRYRPPVAYVLHRGREMETRSGGTTVRILPISRALVTHPWG